MWHSREPVYSLDWHPNGTLVTGGADKELKVWAVSGVVGRAHAHQPRWAGAGVVPHHQAQGQGPLPHPAAVVRRPALLPPDDSLPSCGLPLCCQVSRGADGYAAVQHLSSLAGHDKTVNCVRFSPTGARCRPPAAAGPSPAAQNLRAHTRRRGLTRPAPPAACATRAPAAAGQHLASAGDQGQLLLWEPADPASAPRGNLVDDEGEATWRRAAGLKGHRWVRPSGPGRRRRLLVPFRVACAASAKSPSQARHAAARASRPRPRSSAGPRDDIMDAAWAPDGSALLSGAIDSEALVFDVTEKKRGAQARRLPPAPCPRARGGGGARVPADLAALPAPSRLAPVDGRLLAPSPTAVLPAPPAQAARFDSHKHFIQGCAWDPAGQYVATQSADRTVK